MKILQFTPKPVTTASDKTKKNSEGADFASTLKAATASQSQNAKGPGLIVSLENHRALDLPPTGDLGAAGRLLDRLKNDIRSASAQTLDRIHNLEGLIYVYAKNKT